MVEPTSGQVVEQLRVGLVGGGPWATSIHAPGLTEHPGTRLAAVWTRRPEVARELAEPYAATPCASFAELLDQVDAVAFAVPPRAQAELAVRAARAGKHLILEKPVAADVAGAEELAAAVDEADVVALVVLTLRFGLRTREWLVGLAEAGGWRGASARWLSGALLGEKYGNSAWRQEDGALADIGPHVLDLLDAALGEITEVLAAHRSPDDLWHLMLGHAGGATSTASMSLRLPVRPTVVEFAVYGERGFRALAGRSEPAEAYTALVDDFAAMVASGTRTHPCDIRRGLHLQRLLAQAAHLAAR
ncbi:Predicted dehydrogenase [Amycolatopsis arida]|uniref:Predicted dehydrogenase n=1 Tax=Amycolatopsis arida TaxID=587909 RepID=A0A1I5SWC7_9PSEU|nr:Gfo/Idh/MocA family oxidoreductase [Amycolatopsis arida]TDX96323.1 putative dehydrogenase [Amycolatopsis arida]SFP75028.1 Predicted dehydrogenase [Amycolatopsis arida]